MKTIIIHLEPSDNQFSICEKMEAVNTQRFLLVWPRRGRLLGSELDLDLIKRKAQELGGQVAIVCRNPRVSEYAESLQIPVFPSVPRAEKSHWRNTFSLYEKKEDSQRIMEINDFHDKKMKTTQNRTASILEKVFSIGISILAFAALLVFLLPSAKIVLYPEVEQKEIKVSVWASPEVKEVNPNGNLPAKLQEIEVSGTLDGQSTGTTELASEFAQGNVTFTNLTKNSIEIPSGTIVLTDSAPAYRFETLAPGSLPSGQGGTATVPIQAVEAGAGSNVAAGTITQVEGTLGSLISVENLEAVAAGENQSSPSPTEEDYAATKKKLLDSLREKAKAQIDTEAEKLIEGTLDSGVVLSETRSIEPGQPGDKYSLTITVKYSGLSYSPQDLEKIVRRAAESSLGSSQSIYLDQISSSMGNITPGENSATWEEAISIKTIPVIDEVGLAQSISGQTIESAVSMIKNEVNLRQPPQIVLHLLWSRLPFAAFRIAFQVK